RHTLSNYFLFFFSSRRRHTRSKRDWSSDVCSSDLLDLKVLDEHGKQVVVTMGSYGIGVSRAVAALAEAHHDDKGLIWPMNVAPAHVHIVATGKDEEIFNTAEDI